MPKRRAVGSGRFASMKSLAIAVKAASRPGGPALTDRLSALPRMAKAVSAGKYRGVSGAQIALLSAAAAYIVSPVDLIPEAILGVVGLADDAVVLTWFGSTLVRVTDDFLEWESFHKSVIDGEVNHSK